jgi:hypothetical protein
LGIATGRQSANSKKNEHMEETKRQFIQDLISHPTDLLASVWILDRIPHIFNGDLRAYAVWRHALAKGLGVDASALLITGSAAFGVSLNPYKNYKFFDDASDIDVAVISDHHFMEAWRALRNIGPKMHGMQPKVKQSISDHVQRYIYWGTIATDKLLHLFSFGKQWTTALEEISKMEPTHGRQVNVRVYKDLDSLRAYQVNNLAKLQTEELSKGI